MALTPALRKVVLTVHVVTSVGWLGSVVCYLALDVTAATSADAQAVRVAYSAMALLVEDVIVPLALTSVVVGIVNALGTSWGLLRHYWVIVKLLLTAFATVVLLVESRTVTHLARSAVESAAPGGLPSTLPHSVGGVVVLSTVVALSVFKPRGLTRYGWRRQHQRHDRRPVAEG